MIQKVKDFLKTNNLQIYIVILGLMIALQIYQFSIQRENIAEFIDAGPRFTLTDRTVSLQKSAGTRKAFGCNYHRLRLTAEQSLIGS